jgi:serine/threonine-protein phosphatase 5
MSKEEAIALKDKGNEAFKAHDWPAAVDFYSQAITKYDQEPSFYTNRAQVSQKEDCDNARDTG